MKYWINLVLSIILLLSVLAPAAIRSSVELSGNGSDAMKSTISSRLTRILNSSSLYSEADSSVEHLRQYFQDGIFEYYVRLLEHSRFRTTKPHYALHLLQNSSGAYVIREIVVRSRINQHAESATQYLVFEFDGSAMVRDVYFAIEDHWTRKILDEGNALDIDDLANRERILHYVELYRTAYNTKDLDFIRKAFSDDALVIVGRMLESQPATVDLGATMLSKDQIDYLQLSKTQYIERLEKAFTWNDYIKVQFDNIEVVRDSTRPEVYGVTLKQRWHSTYYRDEGYVFLLIDFEHAHEPLIHVRSWQPRPFNDGSVISIYDFELID